MSDDPDYRNCVTRTEAHWVRYCQQRGMSEREAKAAAKKLMRGVTPESVARGHRRSPELDRSAEFRAAFEKQEREAENARDTDETLARKRAKGRIFI